VTARRALLLAAATLLTLVAARRDTWPGLRGPAPYPPEWQWGYAPRPVVPQRLAPVLGVAGALAGLAALAGRAAAAGRRARVGLLAAATILGLGFQVALLGNQSSGALAELDRRTRSGSFTSYFRIAGSAGDVGAFLSQYHELLPGYRHHALHAATHPPGPILFYMALRRLAAATPRLAAVAGGESRAAALMGALLLGLLGAAACFPVARLARSFGADGASALRAGVLWTLVPGLCLMVPELDQALALPVAGAAAAVGWALEPNASGARRAAGGVLAGVLTGAAVFFSYGAPMLVALGAFVAAAPALGTGAGRRRVAELGAVALATAALCFVAPLVTGYQPMASAVTALDIHREQFTALRSYALWLCFNLVDLVLFLGVPVVLFGLSMTRVPRSFRLAAACGVLLLDASGVVRGEMGRILVPLMPVLLTAAVVAPPSADATDGEPSLSTTLVLACLLAATDIVFRLSWEL